MNKLEKHVYILLYMLQMMSIFFLIVFKVLHFFRLHYKLLIIILF